MEAIASAKPEFFQTGFDKALAYSKANAAKREVEMLKTKKNLDLEVVGNVQNIGKR